MIGHGWLLRVRELFRTGLRMLRGVRQVTSSDQHTWHAAVLPQVEAAIREEVGDRLTSVEVERVARAALAASVTGIGYAVHNGLVPADPASAE